MKQIEWRVRLACAERSIWSATELQRLVLRRTGVPLNVQTLQSWFRQRPVRIEVRTLNAVLNALGCPLTDLIQFEPPMTEREARANPKEAIHFKQRDLKPSKPAKAKKRTKRVVPQPDVGKMLEALVEGASPLAGTRLRRDSAQLSSSPKSKGRAARKS